MRQEQKELIAKMEKLFNGEDNLSIDSIHIELNALESFISGMEQQLKYVQTVCIEDMKDAKSDSDLYIIADETSDKLEAVNNYISGVRESVKMYLLGSLDDLSDFVSDINRVSLDIMDSSIE